MVSKDYVCSVFLSGMYVNGSQVSILTLTLVLLMLLLLLMMKVLQ